MINLAGNEACDIHIVTELEDAGIDATETGRSNTEVPYSFTGKCGGWTFTRSWYYWVARGPGIPFDKAKILYGKFGKDIRSNGHCLSINFPPCGFVTQKDKVVGRVCMYHIDTQEGLNALAKTIRECLPK